MSDGDLKYSPYDSWFGIPLDFRFGGAITGIFSHKLNSPTNDQFKHVYDRNTGTWNSQALADGTIANGDYDNILEATNVYWAGAYIDDPDNPGQRIPTKFVSYRGPNTGMFQPPNCRMDDMRQPFVRYNNALITTGYVVDGAAIATVNENVAESGPPVMEDVEYMVIATHGNAGYDGAVTDTELTFRKMKLEDFVAKTGTWTDIGTHTYDYRAAVNREGFFDGLRFSYRPTVYAQRVSFSGDGKKAAWLDNANIYTNQNLSTIALDGVDGNPRDQSLLQKNVENFFDLGENLDQVVRTYSVQNARGVEESSDVRTCSYTATNVEYTYSPTNSSITVVESNSSKTITQQSAESGSTVLWLGYVDDEVQRIEYSYSESSDRSYSNSGSTIPQVEIVPYTIFVHDEDTGEVLSETDTVFFNQHNVTGASSSDSITASITGTVEFPFLTDTKSNNFSQTTTYGSNNNYENRRNHDGQYTEWEEGLSVSGFPTYTEWQSGGSASYSNSRNGGSSLGFWLNYFDAYRKVAQYNWTYLDDGSDASYTVGSTCTGFDCELPTAEYQTQFDKHYYIEMRMYDNDVTGTKLFNIPFYKATNDVLSQATSPVFEYDTFDDLGPVLSGGAGGGSSLCDEDDVLNESSSGEMEPGIVGGLTVNVWGDFDELTDHWGVTDPVNGGTLFQCQTYKLEGINDNIRNRGYNKLVAGFFDEGWANFFGGNAGLENYNNWKVLYGTETKLTLVVGDVTYDEFFYLGTPATRDG